MSLAVGFLNPIIAYASNLGGTTQACYTPYLAEHRQHQKRNNTPYVLKVYRPQMSHMSLPIFRQTRSVNNLFLKGCELFYYFCFILSLILD